MRLLDLPQARHFCAPSASIIGGISSQSLASFHNSLPKKGVVLLREGTTHFHVHQISLLNSIDRWLVYSLGLYRRSVDMLVPVSAPWAQVTLYYASFFAANAILGIFGCWIGTTPFGERLVDVDRGISGDQQLMVHRNPPSPNGAKGSHRRFWDFFYEGTATISAWAPAELAPALNPVNGDFGWQIAERNKVNYDMFYAWSASTLFFDTFNRSRLRTSGPLQLQLEASETIIRLALYFANAAALSTAALEGCGATGTTQQIQKRLASQAPPNLVMQSEFYSMLGQ